MNLPSSPQDWSSHTLPHSTNDGGAQAHPGPVGQRIFTNVWSQTVSGPQSEKQGGGVGVDTEAQGFVAIGVGPSVSQKHSSFIVRHLPSRPALAQEPPHSGPHRASGIGVAVAGQGVVGGVRATNTHSHGAHGWTLQGG